MFDRNAIGFYLQAEDQLTPALDRVAKSYTKLTKKLDGLNAKLYASASRGLGTLQKMVESLEALPDTTAKAYGKARKELEKKITPMTQEVKLVFTPASLRGLADAVKAAVGKAMSATQFDLTSKVPTKRLSAFKSVPLRKAYREEVQPPDYTGRFTGKRIPHFRQGGPVTPQHGPAGPDNVLAWVSQGEFILNAEQQRNVTDTVTQLMDGVRGVAQAGSSGFVKTGEIKDLVSVVSKLNMNAEQWKEIWEFTRILRRLKNYTKSVKQSTAALGQLDERAKKLTDKSLGKMLPVLTKLRGDLEDVTIAEENTAKGMSVMDRAVKFLAANEAAKGAAGIGVKSGP